PGASVRPDEGGPGPRQRTPAAPRPPAPKGPEEGAAPPGASTARCRRHRPTKEAGAGETHRATNTATPPGVSATARRRRARSAPADPGRPAAAGPEGARRWGRAARRVRCPRGAAPGFGGRTARGSAAAAVEHLQDHAQHTAHDECGDEVL